jgi:hypothetical protein
MGDAVPGQAPADKVAKENKDLFGQGHVVNGKSFTDSTQAIAHFKAAHCTAHSALHTAREQKAPSAQPSTAIHVVVPSGVAPGMPSRVVQNGQSLVVTCPPNVAAGSIVKVMATPDAPASGFAPPPPPPPQQQQQALSTMKRAAAKKTPLVPFAAALPNLSADEVLAKLQEDKGYAWLDGHRLCEMRQSNIRHFLGKLAAFECHGTDVRLEAMAVLADWMQKRLRAMEEKAAAKETPLPNLSADNCPGLGLGGSQRLGKSTGLETSGTRGCPMRVPKGKTRCPFCRYVKQGGGMPPELE